MLLEDMNHVSFNLAPPGPHMMPKHKVNTQSMWVPWDKKAPEPGRDRRDHGDMVSYLLDSDAEAQRGKRVSQGKRIM